MNSIFRISESFTHSVESVSPSQTFTSDLNVLMNLQCQLFRSSLLTNLLNVCLPRTSECSFQLIASLVGIIYDATFVCNSSICLFYDIIAAGYYIISCILCVTDVILKQVPTIVSSLYVTNAHWQIGLAEPKRIKKKI